MTPFSPSTDRPTWPVSNHDPAPPIELKLPSPEAQAYLFAFLHAEGKIFAKPYTPVRDEIQKILDGGFAIIRKAQAPSSSVSEQRLRTWKSRFEDLSLIGETGDGEPLELTRLGRVVRTMFDDLQLRVEGANDHLAKLAVMTLNRRVLAEPGGKTQFPSGCDVHPYRLMWKAMRALDGRLHWQEFNRVLMHVLYTHEEDAAIKHISEVRSRTGGRYSDKELIDLGRAAVDDGAETRRRITPWFAEAGFGGLLLEEAEGDYFKFIPQYLPLIDEVLAEVPSVPAEALASKTSYLRFVADVRVNSSQANVSSDVQAVIKAIKQYGRNKIVCLAGLSGTGKSHLAKAVLSELTEDDPYRFEEIQFHESMGYEDFFEGFVPREDGTGFQLQPKTFRVINGRAARDPQERTFVLLLEEFSRTNVHAVLGELLTYVEHRDRRFRLALSQKEERVAPNLVILATMNPRDKSAAVLDQAVLRRLHVIEIAPSVEKLRQLLENHIEPGVMHDLAAWFEKYLEIVPFGHAVFAEVRSEDDLKALWQGTLRYLLLDALGQVRPAYTDMVAEYPWR